MSIDQIENMLSELGIPFQYHHFTTKDVVDPPFLIWVIPGTSNFMADGKVYQKISQLDLELYTDEKNWDLEERLEAILDKYEIPWEQTASEWIPSESMWESLYEMTI